MSELNSVLRAAVPRPEEPADVPAALLKFAQWVQQQVASVDKDAIIAGALAQVNAPFKTDVFYRTGEHQGVGSVQIPQNAKSMRITVRGGSVIEYPSDGHQLGFYKLAVPSVVWLGVPERRYANELHYMVGTNGWTWNSRSGASFVGIFVNERDDYILAQGNGFQLEDKDPIESDLQVYVQHESLIPLHSGFVMIEWFNFKPEQVATPVVIK